MFNTEVTDDPFNDTRILDTWHKNARSWTNAVRKGEIESRRQVTDLAIIDAVLDRSSRTVLDIGCGEGWLARELAARNIKVSGVDAVPELIEAARLAGGGDFRVMTYEDIAAGKLEVSVDTAVCNFSLLGKESVEGLFNAVPALLSPNGVFIVQTLHPLIACGDLPYEDGWREGSWAGFNEDFTDPAPWYFRTLESWIRLFVDNGFRLREVREPLHPETQKPVSVIFVGAVLKVKQRNGRRK
ncbi:MAG TPA: class I SAM-dependent methyltransferase [Gammaproteobacteria bacterium]